MTEKVTERWTFIGVREGQTRTKVYGWRDEAGEDSYFAKVKGHITGGIYEAQVTRNDDGSFKTVGIHPVWTGERHEDADLLAKWKTQERLAEVSIARKRAERKLRAERDAFQEAIDPLRALYERSGTWMDRTAFIAMVIDELRHS